MVSKKRKNLLKLGLLLGLAAVCLIGGLAMSSWRRDPPARIVSVNLRADDQVTIGTPVAVEVSIRLPWHRWPLRPATIEMNDPEATVLFAEPPELTAVGAGFWEWRLRGTVQVYRTGIFDSGQVRISTTPQRSGDDYEVVVSLPSFAASSRLPPVNPDPRLILAPELPTREPEAAAPWSLPGMLAIGAIAMAIVLSVFFGKPQAGARAQPPTSGEKALRDLLNLESAQRIEPEQFFVRITDILKEYVERRFELSAGSSDSRELQAQLLRLAPTGNPQPTSLAEVLECADRVKFGRQRVDEEAIRQSLTRARRFVAETMPL